MFVIKIFSDFCDSTTCKINFEKTCDSNNLDFYGLNKKVYITDKEDYTHAIILNKAMPILNIPKENVIGLACEPFEFLNINQEFVDYSQKHIGKYFIGNKFNLPSSFIEYFGYMWHLNPGKKITRKNKLISIIVSQKQFAPGHIYRHKLVEKIVQLHLPIDIYGRGSNMYNSSYVKGEFTHAEPYEDYLFSVCIENFVNRHYISEKIMSPIMFNCMPIYHGCNNVKKYFDEVIILTGDIENDIKVIISVLKEPYKYYKKTYTEKNKKTVNLLDNISEIFDM